MRILYCCFAFFCFIHLQCQEKKVTLGSGISEILEIEQGQKNFNGAVVLGNKNEIFFRENYGYSNRLKQQKIAAETCFDIASLNKSFIATLILLAVEEEKLSLETPLVALLKNYDYTGEFHSDITIHHILTHTAGLGDYQHISEELSADNFRKFKAMHFNNVDYVNFLSNIPPIHKPEVAYYYSNFGYHLLCIVLEDIYQLSFADLLQQKICKPYGLQHTFSPQSRNDLNSFVAEGYNLVHGKWEANPYIDLSIGRRIYANAADMYKWGSLLQTPGLLQEKSLDLMFENHLEGISSQYSYGYGWAIHTGGDDLEPGNLGVSQSYRIHGGQTDGFKSILILMDNGCVLSILCNSGNQTDIIDLSKQIVKKIIENEK